MDQTENRTAFVLRRMAEQEALVTLEEKPLEAPEESGVRVLYAARGELGDESDAATKPPLRRGHQGPVCGDGDRTGSQTSTDGPDRRTSVPPELLQLAAGDEPGRSRSVSSSRSDSSGLECPICSELFESRGDRRVTLLHCNHALCHHCAAGIMRRAKDQSRLQCPFCRQTTPFPRWEIQRLQEESYGGGVFCDPGPPAVLSPGPETQAVPGPPLCCFAVLAHTDRRCRYPSCLLGRSRSLCFSITGLLLLFLLVLGVFLYMVVPFILLSVLFLNS